MPDRKTTYEVLVIRGCPLSQHFVCETPFVTPCMMLLDAQSSLLQNLSLVTPSRNAKEIVPLLGHHIPACVMDLAAAVWHFIAPILTSVTGPQ